MEGIGFKGLVASFVLVLVGLFGTVYRQFSPPAPKGAGEYAFVCVNCGEKLTADQQTFGKMQNEKMLAYADELEATNPTEAQRIRENVQGQKTMAMHHLMALTTELHTRDFVCPKCSETSLKQATKCRKCGEIFLSYKEDGSYDDACPKCKYSVSEEARKKRQARKAEEKKRRDKKRKK